MGDVREGRKNWAGGMSGRKRGGEGGRRVEGEKREILRGKFWCGGCGGGGVGRGFPFPFAFPQFFPEFWGKVFLI